MGNAYVISEFLVSDCFNDFILQSSSNRSSLSSTRWKMKADVKCKKIGRNASRKGNENAQEWMRKEKQREVHEKVRVAKEKVRCHRALCNAEPVRVSRNIESILCLSSVPTLSRIGYALTRHFSLETTCRNVSSDALVFFTLDTNGLCFACIIFFCLASAKVAREIWTHVEAILVKIHACFDSSREISNYVRYSGERFR